VGSGQSPSRKRVLLHFEVEKAWDDKFSIFDTFRITDYSDRKLRGWYMAYTCV